LENKNEILVGALTIVGIALFILGFKYLQGESLFTRSKLEITKKLQAVDSFTGFALPSGILKPFITTLKAL